MKELRVRLSDDLYNELVDKKEGLSWSNFLAGYKNKSTKTAKNDGNNADLIQNLSDSLQSVLDLAAGTLPDDVVNIFFCKKCRKHVRSESNTKPFEICPYCGEEDDLVWTGYNDEEDKNKEKEEE